MEKSVQCVSGIERVNIFGVRHLSPGASFHLLKLLDKIKPKCVLIEGPIDANSVIENLTDTRVQPPVAMLAYTSDIPVETVMYPFAEYSPEYQGMLWAKKNNALCSFIDLPSEVLLHKVPKAELENEPEEFYNLYQRVHDEMVQFDCAINFDDYFEKNFEHNPEAYNDALKLQSHEMRQLLEPFEADILPQHNARNLIREAHMAMCIKDAIDQGYEPEKIVVITGAYHAQRLTTTIPMTTQELKLLPRRESKITLMPYSFYRLSSHSGYGAGNSAPSYYQLMWDCMQEGRLQDLPNQYMALLGRYIRENGGYCATSNIIEAVRLARGLAYLKEGSMPTLFDLHNGAIACIADGDQALISTAFAAIDIGTGFGNLPEGMSQTSLQDDFNRELKGLKLEKYKSTVAMNLDLDLRENIRVKSETAAFNDLNRSTFLNRLDFLGVKFATKVARQQDNATWGESWVLKWSPEVEIQLVESTLKGETIEYAAAYQLTENLNNCEDVSKAAELITAACVCKLTGTFESALTVMQKLTADSDDFIKTAKACFAMSQLIQYGDLRRFDMEPIIPLVSQLFLRGALLMVDFASCDHQAATEAATSIGLLHTVSQENYEIIDDETWCNELTALATRDDRNPKLSGLAFAILLERNLADEAFCAKEVSRRLSPGIPADLGAGWFEGMSMRNRYGLLSRTNIWRELDHYITALDDEDFKRSVVFLRRAFSSFDSREKSSVAELLGDLWAMDSEGVSILLQAPLDEEEVEALDALNDFEFDF